jgi:type IV secretion system protein VirD4
MATEKTARSILISCGVRPFLSRKYYITKHHRYKHLSDFDKEIRFDVDRYLARKRRSKPSITPSEVFVC